ncbi:MAG TPA: group II intron maturase-specific domain-containing protein [Rhodanobacteraceae bacterium]
MTAPPENHKQENAGDTPKAISTKFTTQPIKEDWILLYIERWMVAPFETAEGIRVPRERGTPQGGVVSPLLMNLFMHYAFDLWMQRNSPNCPDVARLYNPVIRGWWQYYGAFYKAAMLGVFQHIDQALARWARRKYKALHRRKRASAEWLGKMRTAMPLLFDHWRVAGPQVG